MLGYVGMFFPVTTRTWNPYKAMQTSTNWGRVPNLRHSCNPRPFERLQAKKKLRIFEMGFWKQGRQVTVLVCVWVFSLILFGFSKVCWICFCFFLQISGLICWLVGSVGIPPPLFSWHWVHLGSIAGTTNLIYCSKIIACTFHFVKNPYHRIKYLKPSISGYIKYHQKTLPETNIFPPESGWLGEDPFLLRAGLFSGPSAASFAFKLSFELTSHDGSTIYWGNTQLLDPIHTSSILTYQTLYQNHPKMRPLREYICHGRENSPQFVIPAVM